MTTIDDRPELDAVFFDDRRGPVRYLQALRARWPLIVLLVALAVGAAVLYSMTATERYEASTDLIVTPVSSGDETFIGFSLFREGIEEAQSVVTAARVVVSPQVVERVNDELGIANADRLVQVKPLGQSNIVTIEATASDPERAAEIANTFAEETIDSRTDLFQDELGERIDQLTNRLEAIPADQRERDFESVAIQQRLAELNSLVGAPEPTLRVLSEAVPSDTPSWPRPVMSIAVALLGSLLLGVALAIALEMLDPRLSREDELTQMHRLPILARIPRLSKRALRRVVSREPLPPAAQKAYRVLRANLALAGEDDEPPRSVLVTSAQPGDGKSLTATNLAGAMASAGLKVVLIDWDLHRPRVDALIGVWGRPSGVAHALRDPSKSLAALVPAPGYGGRLQLLLPGADHAYLIRRLNAERVRAVINALAKGCDIIVMDSPPLLEVAEAGAIAEVAEAVVIAVRLGHTRRDRLVELRRMLALRRITPVGFVVTTKRPPRESRSSYYDPEPGPASAEPVTVAPARPSSLRQSKPRAVSRRR